MQKEQLALEFQKLKAEDVRIQALREEVWPVLTGQCASSSQNRDFLARVLAK